MATRSQAHCGVPAPLVIDLVSRWCPQDDPQQEALHLAAQAVQHSKLPFDELETLCTQVRPHEARMWHEIFVHHRQQLLAPRGPSPKLRLTGMDLQRSCSRIASCVRAGELRDAHEVNRAHFRRLFLLDDGAAERQYLVNFAGPAEGQHLAEYLGIAKERVLTLKPSSSVRQYDRDGNSSWLKHGSSALQSMRDKISRYAGLAAMAGGNVTVLGHYRWDEQDRTQCGFLRSDELLQLFGPSLRPQVFNLFFCGSQPFAEELQRLLPVPGLTVNFVRRGEEVNIRQGRVGNVSAEGPADARCGGDGPRDAFFYYGGPNVEKNGDIGKFFGPKQTDALALFGTLRVGGASEAH